MVKQTRTLVGYFPSKFNGIWGQTAGYDPTRQVVYAYLSSSSGDDPALHAMNATTGALLATRPWPANILMTDFVIDPASGIAYAAIANRTATGVWRKMLARLELHRGSSRLSPKKCYDQLNNAFFANGQFFITAFSHVGTKSVPETVLGVNVSTGRVTLEHPHRNGNMVDMAWTPWEKTVLER